MGFFLRWLNKFAAKSAEEEFKAKQLELDLTRASWLVELYFESVAAGDSQGLPPHLIEQLSKNLFLTEDSHHDSMTASDALASALVNSAAQLDLQLPGANVQLGKPGLKNLSKKSVPKE